MQELEKRHYLSNQKNTTFQIEEILLSKIVSLRGLSLLWSINECQSCGALEVSGAGGLVMSVRVLES